jgi:hypothetical protein
MVTDFLIVCLNAGQARQDARQPAVGKLMAGRNREMVDMARMAENRRGYCK